MAAADLALVLVEFTVVVVEKNTRALEYDELVNVETFEKNRLYALERRIVNACRYCILDWVHLNKNKLIWIYDREK